MEVEELLQQHFEAAAEVSGYQLTLYLVILVLAQEGEEVVVVV